MESRILNIMYVQAFLVLTVSLFVNAFECPNYCTCIDSFLTNSNDRTVKVKCTRLENAKDFADKMSQINQINAIDLSGIDLLELPTNFSNFIVLTHANLSYNQLHNIPKLNNLITHLNLAHNQLQSASIMKLPLHAQLIDLSHNQITHLPRDLMRLNRLQKIELAGNPINCNCDTLKVRNWLMKNFVSTDVPIKCGAPKKFKLQSWLDVNEFHVCQHHLTKPQENSFEGDNDFMFADEGVSNFDGIEGSGSSSSGVVSGTEQFQRSTSIQPPKTTNKLRKKSSKGSDDSFLAMAKDVMDTLPKKKSEDGSTEVYATSGAAGVIIVVLTVFAVYKKRHTGEANIENGENGEELKTIGGLELAKATELVMSIDKQLQSKKTGDSENDGKIAEDVVKDLDVTA